MEDKILVNLGKDHAYECATDLWPVLLWPLLHWTLGSASMTPLGSEVSPSFCLFPPRVHDSAGSGLSALLSTCLAEGWV